MNNNLVDIFGDTRCAHILNTHSSEKYPEMSDKGIEILEKARMTNRQASIDFENEIAELLARRANAK